MKKYLWPVLVMTGIFVVATVSYLFRFNQDVGTSPVPVPSPQEQPQAMEPGTPFYSGGKIARDSASSGAPWYFEYTLNGQQMRTRLGFENDAQCTRNRQTTPCADFEIRPNEIATVNGEFMQDYIKVNSMFVTVSQPVPDTSGVFREDPQYGFYGTITLTGYLDIRRRVCEPDSMCGQTVDYAFFVFGDSGNDAMEKFTGSNDGNSFVAGDRIGIGCNQTDKLRIYYENDADVGYITGQITGSDYTRLIAATPENPVQIKMTREVYTGGRGAPDCYAHFRDFDVL